MVSNSRRWVRSARPKLLTLAFLLGLTRLFVGCDIISFFVQCSGSAIASSGNWAGPSAATGVDVLIGGLSFQVATFLVYLCIFARFHWLARRCAIAEAPGGWQTLVGAVYVSSSLILVRRSSD